VPAADDVSVFWKLFITRHGNLRTFRPDGRQYRRPSSFRSGIAKRRVTGINGPAFNDIRRRFGTGLALTWIAMLWRWGLMGPGVRRYKPRARYARRRSRGLVLSVVQWIILASVGSVWILWAFLMVKGVIAYAQGGH
jgi:hypothetical protein